MTFDNLKAEMEEYITHSPYIRSFKDCCRLRDDVIRIIDKYNTESEEGAIISLDEAIKIFTNNAEYERSHGNLQGYFDFKQLARWLKELLYYKEQLKKDCIFCKYEKNKISEYPCNQCMHCHIDKFVRKETAADEEEKTI